VIKNADGRARILRDPFPATSRPRFETGMKDYPLLKKGENMSNQSCCSYRRRLEKLERLIIVSTMVLRLILIGLQIWTLID